jgi:hypothetical protein
MELLIAVIVAGVALAAVACWLVRHVFLSWQNGLDREARQASAMARVRAAWGKFPRAGARKVSRPADDAGKPGADI